MASTKKILAIICVIVIMVVTVVVPYSKFTGSTLILPSQMTSIDNIGMYSVEFIPSTLSMPRNYLSLDNFDAESAWNWQPHYAELEYSEDRGYGTVGKSAHVTWSAAAWGGIKTNLTDINLQLKGDGITFWAYNVGGRLADFAVVLTQGGVKYEKKITLKAGEAVYTIPLTDFVNGDAVIDPTGTVSQIDFTKSASSAEYYLDEIGFYNKDGSCVEHIDADEDGICNICGHTHVYGDWVVETEATKDANGSKYKECVCGDKITAIIPRVLHFRGASLSLESNIAINYRFLSVYNNIYDEIYLVVNFNGKKYTLHNPEYSNAYGEFSFKKVSSHLMADVATATLYGVLDGEVYEGQTVDYSVVLYAQSMLSKEDTSINLKRLIVDLVNYGAAAQIYTNHNTTDLANAWLSDAQKALGTQGDPETETHKNLKYAVIDNPKVEWKGAALKLESAITIRYQIETTDLTNLKAVLTINGKTFEVPSSEFIPLKNKVNCYIFYFNKLNAAQMSMPVLATIYEGDTAVSNTIQYSIESYVHSYKTNGNTKLTTLVKEMLKYGDSAYAYANDLHEITATFEWHPGLPNEDVYYDLTVMVDDEIADASSYTITSEVDGVTASENRVTLKYSAREKGENVIITVKHNSGSSCDISIPCYKWTQTFNDDFNGTELDRTKWREGSTLTTVAPDDADTYTVIDRAKQAKDCFTVGDGKLNMLIKSEPTYDTTNKIKYLYSECCLSTADKFEQTFGLFQARVASAEFSGINTAFWLLPKGSYSKYYTNFLSSDPRYGLAEIDIYESSVAFGNYDRRTFAISEHFYDYTNNYEAGNKRSAYYKVDDEITNFHTYSCVWTENALYYYVDNQLIRISGGLQTESADGREINPVYMIVDVSLYLDNGWVGKRDFEDSDLPIAGHVDWVRAYSFN